MPPIPYRLQTAYTLYYFYFLAVRIQENNTLNLYKQEIIQYLCHCSHCNFKNAITDFKMSYVHFIGFWGDSVHQHGFVTLVLHIVWEVWALSFSQSFLLLNLYWDVNQVFFLSVDVTLLLISFVHRCIYYKSCRHIHVFACLQRVIYKHRLQNYFWA